MHVGVCDSATSHSRMKPANVFEVVFSLPLAVSSNTSVKVLRTALQKALSVKVLLYAPHYNQIHQAFGANKNANHCRRKIRKRRAPWAPWLTQECKPAVRVALCPLLWTPMPKTTRHLTGADEVNRATQCNVPCQCSTTAPRSCSNFNSTQLRYFPS
jgi:hypothetical protein